jgi:hypothetical protein
MARRAPLLPCPAVLCAALLAVPEEQTLRLASVRVDPDERAPAAGLEGATLPARALRAEIGGVTYLFFDLDGDGEITPGAKDGFTVEPSAFVVRLPSTVLLPAGQCAVRIEKKKLVLTPQELAVEPRLLAEAALLTELRLRAGLDPVLVDDERSADALAHCRYLALNDRNTPAAGLAVHEATPSEPGFTEGGALAGRLGMIAFGPDLRADLLTWYASAFHGPPILDPYLRTIGVAHDEDVSLLYPVTPEQGVSEPLPHPPDGARDVPLAFAAEGEMPNPVPGTEFARGSGFPIFVRLPGGLRKRPIERFELLDEDGRAVEARVSSPAAPATEAWPTNGNCALLIPLAPLEPAHEYRAVLRLQGMSSELAWSFRTTAESRQAR